MASQFARRLGLFSVSSVVVSLFAACAPSVQSQSPVATSGADIVNGVDAKSTDVASQGLAESVVVILSTIKSPDRSKVVGQALCTGTLIDPQVVLTAAHCVADGIQAADVAVGLHFVNLQEEIQKPHPQASGYGVKAFIMNPGYAPTAGGRQQDDLAILLLAKPVPTGTRIAQLPPANLNLAALQGLLAIGYGQSDERHNAGENNGSGILRYTAFPQGKFELLPTDGSISRVFEGMIASDATGTSVCHGDSGGPLMAVMNGASTNVIVGVNDAVLPSYQGQQQTDYETAMKTGDLDSFYKKYPSANICSGGANVFVNVAAQLPWIAATKARLLAAANNPTVVSQMTTSSPRRVWDFFSRAN